MQHKLCSQGHAVHILNAVHAHRHDSFAELLLIVQVWDAINNPLIGTLIDYDRRKYRLGKFRTYILIGSSGLLFAGALCFVPVPGAPSMAKNMLYHCNDAYRRGAEMGFRSVYL